VVGVQTCEGSCRSPPQPPQGFFRILPPSSPLRNFPLSNSQTWNHTIPPLFLFLPFSAALALFDPVLQIPSAPFIYLPLSRISGIAPLFEVVAPSTSCHFWDLVISAPDSLPLMNPSLNSQQAPSLPALSSISLRWFSSFPGVLLDNEEGPYSSFLLQNIAFPHPPIELRSRLSPIFGLRKLRGIPK